MSTDTAGNHHERHRPGPTGPPTSSSWGTTGPTIGADEVLVACGPPGSTEGRQHLMTGVPYPCDSPVRAAWTEAPGPGLDLAGESMPSATMSPDSPLGDDVFGIGKGTFAEFAAPRRASSHRCRRTSVRPGRRAAVSGLTALQALCDIGRVKAGQRVLIIGASGGVGSLRCRWRRHSVPT